MANFFQGAGTFGANVYYPNGSPCGCHSAAQILFSGLGIPFEYINFHQENGLNESPNLCLRERGTVTLIGCAAKRLASSMKAKKGCLKVEAHSPHHFPDSPAYFLGSGHESPLALDRTPVVPGRRKMGYPLLPIKMSAKKTSVQPMTHVLVYEAAGSESSRRAHKNLFKGECKKVLILGMEKKCRTWTKEAGNKRWEVQVKGKIPKHEFQEAICSAQYFVTSGVTSFLEAIFMNPRLPVWFEWKVNRKLTQTNKRFVRDVRENGIPDFAGEGYDDDVYLQFKNASREKILRMNEEIRFRCMTSHLQFLRYIIDNINDIGHDHKITHPITNKKVNIMRYHLDTFLSYLKEPYFCKANIEKLSGFLSTVLEDSPDWLLGHAVLKRNLQGIDTDKGKRIVRSYLEVKSLDKPLYRNILIQACYIGRAELTKDSCSEEVENIKKDISQYPDEIKCEKELLQEILVNVERIKENLKSRLPIALAGGEEKLSFEKSIQRGLLAKKNKKLETKINQQIIKLENLIAQVTTRLKEIATAGGALVPRPCTPPAGGSPQLLASQVEVGVNQPFVGAGFLTHEKPCCDECLDTTVVST